MTKVLIRSMKRFASRVKQHLNQWSKPAIASIGVGSLSDLRRSRKDLIIENAMQLWSLHCKKPSNKR